MTRFEDQVAIVTGGADGIGKAVAERLAAEGATVELYDRNAEMAAATAEEFSGSGYAVSSQAVDVSDEGSVRDAVASTVESRGQLDIMINCAGIVGPNNVKILEYATEAFDSVLAVNLRGSFLMTRYALAPMVKRGSGRILLISSIGGKEGNPGMCGYSTSKAGVLGLVKAIGKEYAESGVTINGLAPAVVRTRMVDETDPAMVTYMTDKIPMKRTGELEEVAAMCAFIVSPECSFCTGYTFDISGGRATY